MGSDLAIGSLRLEPAGSRICRLLDEQGRHVGNLKLIGGRWKFKAVGSDETGGVIPGAGPLTDRHNTVLERLDAAEIIGRLGRAGGEDAPDQ